MTDEQIEEIQQLVEQMANPVGKEKTLPAIMCRTSPGGAIFITPKIREDSKDNQESVKLLKNFS